ncbi:MAG TPA: phosphate acyltransferase PlsX [Candidatus Eisenbacteria bacterium]
MNAKRPITVGVDGMGGDEGPGVIVEGALMALREMDAEGRVALIGDQRVLEAEVRRFDPSGSAGSRLLIEHAAEAVGMGEEAATAARRKKESSLAVGTRLMKEGRIDALFSAGNTGAMVAASLLGVGRIPGVQRPALATRVPADTPSGFCVILDVGATADCKPAHLAQFAVMGDIYTRRILGVAEPRVGLLNIGEESSKGNELAREAHALMTGLPIRFAGNVEGRDIFRGHADVVVTDGFTGNIVLKFLESVAGWTSRILKDEIKSNLVSQLGALLLMPGLKGLRRRLDYSEYGGAPLLGVNGACIVGHGRSSAKAVKNGLKAGAAFVRESVNDRIHEAFGKERAEHVG